MSWIDSPLLLDRVAYGFMVSRIFVVTQVQLFSGKDKRNAETTRPRHRCEAPYSNIQADHHALVVDAFNACLGPVHSFRFFDRMDYLLDDVIIGTADGGTDQEIQLIKPHAFGGQTTDRIITKPVDSAVDYQRGEEVLGAAPAYIITADNTPISFSIDYTTGIMTLTETLDEVIRATGWFDIPVHFEHAQLSFSINEKNAHSSDIDLIEDFDA